MWLPRTCPAARPTLLPTHLPPPHTFSCRLIGIPTSPECEQVAPIGNSPTFFTLDDMRKVMPYFLNMSIVVYKDAEAKQVWEGGVGARCGRTLH